MIERTFSPTVVEAAVGEMAEEIGPRFLAEEWLSHEANIALVNDRGDVALFEAHGSPGVFHGHYFFQSRGREAVLAAKEFLLDAVTNYPVERLLGYTPVRKLGAMWLTRHLGFTPLLTQRIGDDDFQVWTMHKKEIICLA